MRVLEFNDAALSLADADRVHATSPGFAFVDGRKLLFGEAARQQFRAQPRKTQFRYWYQLDQAPLDSPFGEARSHADLAWTQLSGIQANGGDGVLLLAVPASFDTGQLSLLLALARAAKLNAVGLVDAAVAAASTVDAKPTMLHLDVQLHRWWLTRMRAGTEIARSGGEDLSKPGLLAVWDACAGVIAEAFVRQTRFDPLHSAATEQALYDRLPNWLAQFGRGAAVTLELPAGLRSHRASLPADALNGALAALSSRRCRSGHRRRPDRRAAQRPRSGSSGSCRCDHGRLRRASAAARCAGAHPWRAAACRAHSCRWRGAAVRDPAAGARPGDRRRDA